MILVSLLVAAAIAATPQKPTLSEIFEAKVSVDFHEGNHHAIGEGVFVVDQPANKSLESFDFYGKREKFWFLQRFDLGFVYRFEKQKCHADPVKGGEPAVWGFLKDAKYEGEKVFKKRKFDVWGIQKGHGQREELGVFADDISRPGFWRRTHPGGELLYEFFTFHTKSINQSHFDVPAYCP